MSKEVVCLAYLVLNLGPRIPHLQEDRLQEPVPDVEGQRDQYAGYAHHVGLKIRFALALTVLLNQGQAHQSALVLH